MGIRKRLGAGLSLALTAALLLLSTAGVLPANTAHAATGTTYYVDSAAGNDGNSGTSESAPWKTLGRVSSSTSIIKPGDQVLLKSGSVWNQPLNITFSGDADNQITIGKYGGEQKPLINGGGGGYAINIENQQYVTVQDIEMTNYNAANYDDYKSAYYRRSGVWIRSYHQGVKNNIELKRLEIHDVTGISVTGEEWVTDTNGDSVNKNHNAAIMVNAWEWEPNVPYERHAYYNNLLIEDCYIHDIKTIGITLDGYQQDVSQYHQNVVIRNNIIEKTGSDGMIIGVAANPLIEYNAAYDVGINSVDGKWIAGMWTWKTAGATFQHNEVARVHYKTSASTDSFAFDVDILAQGDHLFQYNYSHDNSGGFAMDMGHLKNGKNIYRYNISQNDAHHGYSGYTMNIADPGIYYNNVFYNDNGDGFLIKNNAQATFMNNIFYTTKGNMPYPKGPKFYSNNFFGSAPPSQGVNNLTVDPKFVNPGQGGDGLGSTDGYRLQPDSSLIGAGRTVDDNGGYDYWGNPLYTGAPDIGAFEDPDSTIDDTTAPAEPTALAVVDATDTTITLAWHAAENNVPLDADIYDAATDAKVASVVMSNSYTLTGLAPATEYTYYVAARDFAGNNSPPSADLTARTTIASIVVDDEDAVVSGEWTMVADASAYDGNYIRKAAGSGANTVTWTPDLPQDGYYSVYYWLPQGSSGRASNAPFTVHFDGGSQTYAVDERGAGGSWILLGTHKFKAGTSGTVLLSDQAGGEVAADAVKFQYHDGFGLDRITEVVLTTDKLQLQIGDTMGLSVSGKDASGKTVNLLAEGADVEYIVDGDAVAVSEDGVVTGIAQGTASIGVTVAIDGRTFASNSVQLFVGEGLTVTAPVITDSNGNAINSLSPYGAVQASALVVNSTDRQQGATLVVAVFDRNGLVKSSSQDIAVKSYEYGTVTATVIMPEQVAGSYLKVFVWDGRGSQRPLASDTVFPSE